jgi:hypothetical protein
VEKLNTLTPKGRIINLLGDARKLTELLAERVGVVITSPPFGDINLSAGDPERRRERLLQAGRDPNDFLGGSARNAVLKHYGQADAVIVSPPYSDSNPFDKKDPEFWKRAHELGNRWTPDPPRGVRNTELSQGNIGNLPLGPVDAVITSPPFGQTTIKKEFESEAELEEFAKKQWLYVRGGRSLEAVKRAVSGWHGCPESPENIGNLSLGPVNAVITSPPFGEANRGGGIAVKGYEGRHGKDPELHLRHDRPLSDNPDNISNLAFGDAAQLDESQVGLQQLYKKLLTKKGKPTYLSEMLLVYKNMCNVLKPGGTACVVVKPFVKDRKVVDLPYITWCLLRAIGFVLEKAYKWRIERPSFWRILYVKKNPDVPLVAHEYVVVVRKPDGSGA